VVTSTKRFRGPSGLPIWSGLASRSGPGLLDVCRHIYARAGRGAVAVFDVEDNDGLHRILNEWADIVPAHFDTYPLIEGDAAQRMLAAKAATLRG